MFQLNTNYVVALPNTTQLELRKLSSNDLKLLDTITMEHLQNGRALELKSDAAVKALANIRLPHQIAFTAGKANVFVRVSFIHMADLYPTRIPWFIYIAVFVYLATKAIYLEAYPKSVR